VNEVGQLGDGEGVCRFVSVWPGNCFWKYWDNLVSLCLAEKRLRHWLDTRVLFGRSPSVPMGNILFPEVGGQLSVVKKNGIFTELL
jgi:hypothetical protein